MNWAEEKRKKCFVHEIDCVAKAHKEHVLIDTMPYIYVGNKIHKGAIHSLYSSHK